MRISDWSSDVCSSDLTGLAGKGGAWRLSPSGGGADVLGSGRLAAPSALHPVDHGVRRSPRRTECARVAWAFPLPESGRASCRERGCQYVWISVVAVSYKKKNR